MSDIRTSIANTNDIFIAKINANGSYAWTQTMGASGFDIGHSITVDHTDNVYVVGHYQNVVDLDPTPKVALYGSHFESVDVFIAKYSAGGIYQWTNTFGGPEWDGPYAVTVDGADNVYISGLFAGTTNLDPTTITDSSTGVLPPFTHPGLVNERVYYYVFEAINADGNSISQEIALIPLATNVP